MPEATTIHLVRHGKVLNPDDIYYGRSPNFPIAEIGKQQAASAGKILRDFPIAALYSSPMQRARETAQIILKEFDGLSVQIVEEINEIHTPYDGQLFSTLAANNWDVYAKSEPPFEQPIDLITRVKKFVGHMLKAHQGQQVVGVTHGDVIGFMTLFAMGEAIVPASKKLLDEKYPSYASITSFTYQTQDEDEVPGLEARGPFR